MPKNDYTDRICFWCKNSVTNCLSGCQCTFCVFESQFHTWKEDHKELYDFWIKKNSKFYDELFDKAIIEETELVRRWKLKQLPILEKTNTRIYEWIEKTNFTTNINQYNEIILKQNNPGGYRIITPYYDYVGKKTKANYVTHCQLCGTDIKKKFYIKHGKKKLAICIGGDCGLAFYYSILIGKDIRNFMNKVVNKLFNDSIPFIRKKLNFEIFKSFENNDKKHELWCKDILIRIDNHQKKKPLGPRRIVDIFNKLNDFGIMSFFD